MVTGTCEETRSPEDANGRDHAADLRLRVLEWTSRDLRGRAAPEFKSHRHRQCDLSGDRRQTEPTGGFGLSLSSVIQPTGVGHFALARECQWPAVMFAICVAMSLED